MGFCDAILEYIIKSMNITDSIEDAPWVEVVGAFSICNKENTINTNLPIYRVKSLGHNPEPWDYEGRTWYVWAHTFAKNYGWSLEYIAELDVDEAIPLLEEIYVNDQLDKEFIWMGSEIAYPYNPNSKKSEFKALPRPGWMMKESEMLKTVEQLKHTKIPMSLIPMGKIVKMPLPEDENVRH